MTVVTDLQFIIEAMLRAAIDPFTAKKHISYQIIISWNAKFYSLYIALPSFLLSAAAVATLRLTRTRKLLLRASCANIFKT